MRKILFGGSLALLVLVGGHAGDRLFANQDRAFVAFLEGKAEVAAGPNGPWRRLALKSVVNDSQYIRTGKKSKMMLRYRGVDVRLLGQSHMQIRSLANKRAADLKLSRGFAWIHLKEKRKLSVTTPTSVAAVRGTKFAMAADDDGTVSCVCEGRVATESIDGKQTGEMRRGGSHTFGADGKFKKKNLKKYFRKLKVDVTFKREIRKERKYRGCLSCHKMVDLKKDTTADDEDEDYW